LATIAVLGVAGSGLWLAVLAPERWQRVLGQLLVWLASLMMLPLYFRWRSWRTQRAAHPDRRR
jgi:hypothetical protein